MPVSNPSRGPELPRPVLQAMLVCDQAIREAETNKVTLVGIIHRILGLEFPLLWSRPTTVYARVTDAEGEYAIGLELIRLEDEQTIGRVDSTATLPDRMASHEIIFNLDGGLLFERPGIYEFRLFADGRPLGRVAFSVIQVHEQ